MCKLVCGWKLLTNHSSPCCSLSPGVRTGPEKCAADEEVSAFAYAFITEVGICKLDWLARNHLWVARDKRSGLTRKNLKEKGCYSTTGEGRKCSLPIAKIRTGLPTWAL